jgi:hypothetical protein
MAWNDPNETVIGGTGQVYVAPVGTALPANESSALNSAFVGLGYHSEDGVSVNQSIEIIRLGAWQSKKDIRRLRDAETFRITFNLLQWNENNVPLAFGGGTVSDLGGSKYKYSPPASSEALAEKAMVCDVQDGTEILRFVIPRGSVVEAVESQFARNAFGQLPVAFEDMEPDDGTPGWHLLTNIADFAAGS